MNIDELGILNDAIASLHEDNDVGSLSIDKSRQIKFPRGYLRTLEYYRDFFPYIKDQALLTRIASHLMHRDTLHWIWLKTDICCEARSMVIKFQLITLASVLEGVVKHLIPKTPKKKDTVYWRIDKLQSQDYISNCEDLKQLWYDRNSIHLHLDKFEESPISFSDENYQKWHTSMRVFMTEMKLKFSIQG
jgi:hypothetical protein